MEAARIAIRRARKARRARRDRLLRTLHQRSLQLYTGLHVLAGAPRPRSTIAADLIAAVTARG